MPRSEPFVGLVFVDVGSPNPAYRCEGGTFSKAEVTFVFFFVIESILAIVIALLFGIVAGWLVWGGERKKPVAAGISSGAVAIESESDTADTKPSVANAASTSAVGALSLAGAPDERLIALEREYEEVNAEFEELRAELEDTRADLEELHERVASRDGDVSRLKAKLRKAVEEIERRTAIATAARDELAQERARVAALAAEIEEAQAQHEAAAFAGNSSADASTADRPPVNLAPVFDLDSDAASRAAMTEEQIEERVRARTASLTIQTEALERRMNLAASRADEAERELASAKLALADAQAKALEGIAGVRRESDAQIGELESELARANAKVAHSNGMLTELAAELQTIRDANSSHLQRVHTSIGDLSQRLDSAKAVLDSGASIAASPERPTSVMLLPGITDELAVHLNEIGVGGLEEVARWTDDDVSRVQSWLPDHPGIIIRNNWVRAARAALAEENANLVGQGNAVNTQTSHEPGHD
jgi:peptidoglycan hydrolase CwlO-like protein